MKKKTKSTTKEIVAPKEGEEQRSKIEKEEKTSKTKRRGEKGDEKEG
ncbi:hypothetical protein OIV50_32075 [Burkholderia pseudomallei]|nr:hypothetical protein [Burkholderia pseudomallei]MCW0033950.1 hypothetical protein [Burkholderia pseudomallei]